FADEYHRWQRQPHTFELPTRRESYASGNVTVAAKTYRPVQALYREARKFWINILSRHVGGTVLVVSHSGTIHALLSTALGIAPSAHHSLQQSNCGISELRFFGGSFSQASVQLHQLNRTSAIGETLPKLKISKKGLRLLLLPSECPPSDSHPSLVEKLQKMPIDFYLSTDEDRSRLQPLIRQRFKALWLCSQKSDFLQDWQRHLRQSKRSAETLMTGLAIAPTRSIQKLLLQTLGSDTKNYHGLAIYPTCLSVIHYPYTHKPVVQVVNL
ncbi:MAG: histidine phosphatase family protein, partial [Cyanobacteria bacterium J06649_4]